MTLRRVLQMVIYALRRRCPNCGGHPIFASWFRMAPTCPQCGLAFERQESGYIVGAYMFNMVGSELVFMALLAVVVIVLWPTPPWDLLTYGGAVLMVLLPILFYPYSKTIFLGFDLLFRPANYATTEVAAPPDEDRE